MQILSVSLRDFKIHHDRSFEFQPGVNAICGENGAGKTSILEAIAWVLFNFSGDYRKEELYRQGGKHTQVTVRIVSAVDGRVYDVQRQSSKSRADSYTIHDCQLDQNVEGIHRLSDAEQWLRQNLGISNTTNLGQLFADVIGIPQGTFTADFLKKPGDRRKVFDPILQVEDYKQAFQASAALKKYAEGELAKVEQALESTVERLQDWDSLREQKQELETHIQDGEAMLAKVTVQLEAAQQQWQVWKTQQDQVQQLQNTLVLSQQQQQQLEGLRSRQVLALEQAKMAAQQCDRAKAGYEAYGQLTEVVQALGQRRSQRDQLQQELWRVERQQQQQALQAANLQAQGEQRQQQQQQLAALEQQIPEQEDLENQLKILQVQIQTQMAIFHQRQTLAHQQQQSQQQHTQLQARIQQLEPLEPIAATVEAVEAEYQRSQARQTYGVAAQVFEQQLQSMVGQGRSDLEAHREAVILAQQTLTSAAAALPLWSSPLTEVNTTLETGSQLHQDLIERLETEILADLAQQRSDLKQDAALEQLGQQLQAAKAAQLQVAELESLRSTWADLTTTIKTTQTELDRLDGELATHSGLEQQRQALESNLAALGDPRRQVAQLRQQLQQTADLEQRLVQLQGVMTPLEQEKIQIQGRLQEFSDLEAQIQTQEQIRQSHANDYQTYLQQSQLAQRVPQVQGELSQTLEELAQVTDHVGQIQAQLTEAQQNWDPQRLAAAEANLYRLQQERGQWAGALPEQRKALDQVRVALEQRQQWAAERDRLMQEKSEKQQIVEFVTEARRVYNQSGPRITGFYLDEIRREGDRLFRELMNRQGVALTWTDDYEIQVQEDKTWRSFRTLSGGEQMAAALAVRLALLKVLAELDIAFFDEPTTNMDRDRREQLAEVLGNLRTFQQLFIISHDDTFENLTENVIRVDRAGG
ncbi:MAG: AAA family ATPase [Prochlorothrix sp.]|nr:SMC family ATPase [Prochlorothrix sp.]